MTPSEAAQVLARAAAFDNRTASEIEARAWAETLPDVQIDDAIKAVVRHYRGSNDRLTPRRLLDQLGPIAFDRDREAARTRGLPGAPPASRGGIDSARSLVREFLRSRKPQPTEEAS